MESVREYQVITPWTTAGAGMCQWALAEKGGKRYFVKRFLQPTYPTDDGPGSPATKALKREECERFEKHHQRLKEVLSAIAGDGGHLVVTRGFFRIGAKYYKVTDWIETSTVRAQDVAGLESPRARVIIALSLTHALAILHRQGIVHGDIKPENVLIKLASKDVYVAKLIDFDDSYATSEPPSPDEVVGDQAYYSPELVQYLLGEAAGSALTCASDVFALGIVLCEYFSGSKPTVVDPGESTSGAVAMAALTGRSLRTGLESTWPTADSLVRSMLRLDPTTRPNLGRVTTALKAMRDRVESASVSMAETPSTGAAPSGDEKSALRFGPSIASASRGTASSGATRLKGSLAPKDPAG